MNNDPVHEDHLSMFSVSGDLPSLDVMVDTLLVHLLSPGLKYVEVILFRPSFLQVCRRSNR